jgi:hypothetical protein
MTRRSISFIQLAVLLGSFVTWVSAAIAGSDKSSDTYAGDYTGGSLPIGTFIALQYVGYSHAGAIVDSAGHVLPNSHANVALEFTRFAYFAEIGGRPLVLEAAIPFATLTDVNLPGTNSLVAGGLVDPVIHLTYFLTADAKVQRWIGFTNYFYLPLGRRFDNLKAVNVSTAGQFTDVTQVGYTEGLGKFFPALNNLFLDFVANASFHTRGTNPILVVNPSNAPLAGLLAYESVKQNISYNAKAFLRFEPKTFLFVALGIEKSWGGEQIATNGSFSATSLPIVRPQGDISLGRDDYLRGHLQFQIPVTTDFAVAGDIFRDFEAQGGLRNDFGIEVRLTKFFFPQPQQMSRR